MPVTPTQQIRRSLHVNWPQHIVTICLIIWDLEIFLLTYLLRQWFETTVSSETATSLYLTCNGSLQSDESCLTQDYARSRIFKVLNAFAIRISYNRFGSMRLSVSRSSSRTQPAGPTGVRPSAGRPAGVMACFTVVVRIRCDRHRVCMQSALCFAAWRLHVCQYFSGRVCSKLVVCERIDNWGRVECRETSCTYFLMVWFKNRPDPAQGVSDSKW